MHIHLIDESKQSKTEDLFVGTLNIFRPIEPGERRLAYQIQIQLSEPNGKVPRIGNIRLALICLESVAVAFTYTKK